LIAFKKTPVIGPCEFDVAAMMYTSVGAKACVKRSSPFPSEVSDEPFKVRAEVIVKGMKVLKGAVFHRSYSPN
jgi:hypothetical protein